MVTLRVVTLGQMVAVTGPQIDDPSGLAAGLGLCSQITVVVAEAYISILCRP